MGNAFTKSGDNKYKHLPSQQTKFTSNEAALLTMLYTGNVASKDKEKIIARLFGHHNTEKQKSRRNKTNVRPKPR